MKNIGLIFSIILSFQILSISQVFIDTNADVKCDGAVVLSLIETDFQNNGTFDAGASSVYFVDNGASNNQSISGTGTLTLIKCI